jgi:hypothetical protein
MAILAHLASAVYALGLDAWRALQWDASGAVHVDDGLAQRSEQHPGLSVDIWPVCWCVVPSGRSQMVAGRGQVTSAATLRGAIKHMRAEARLFLL